MSKKKSMEDRLSDYGIKPSNYCITIKPDARTFTFSGHEIISAECRSPVREIRLNSSEIKIKSAFVESKDGEEKAKVTEESGLQRIRLSLNRRVSGKIKIKLEFEGINNDGMYGFYRSTYSNNGKKCTLLSTQFEATNARNAFPCFDEPELKATFDISIVVDKTQDCISNMPEIESVDMGDGKKAVIFKRTPKMSTYLVYFGVGNFDILKSKMGNLEVRIISTPGKKQLCTLAMDYTKKFVAFYEKYFGIKYPLPKLDMIAIPDYAAGAMENWGAITFREINLIADKNTSEAAKQRIAEVIAHELAHQWFGDLVTMKWWNDLWLNESFATFMSYKAQDELFKEWKISEQFLEKVTSSALGADQLASTHPISVEVNSPEEIDQIFDSISYEKGCSVLKMIEDYASESTFREGLRNYLKKHSYSNATKDDLWGAIQDAADNEGSKKKIIEVAQAWIENPGYPIVSISKSGTGISVSQERYFLLKDSKDSTIWPIPISYKTSKSNASFLLEKKSGSIRDMKDGLINGERTGFYRVRYSKEILSRLFERIAKHELNGKEEWGIINDLFALARSGRVRAEEYLDFAENHHEELSYPANSANLRHLIWLSKMLPDGDEKQRATRLTAECGFSILKKLGWSKKKGEPIISTMLRGNAIYASAFGGKADVISKARKLFGEYMRQSPSADPNIMGPIYSINAMYGGSKEFSKFTRRFVEARMPEEKLRILGAIGQFRDKKLLERALQLSASNKVRKQDSIYIPASVSSDPSNLNLLWEWETKNWKALMSNYASGTHMLGRYIENFGYSSNKETISRINEFFGKKGNMRNDLKKPIRQTSEIITSNANFSAANCYREK